MAVGMSSEPPQAPRTPSKPGELFGIERRSLACFRIGLGLLLLLDLWGRARTLREHYTGEGVYPREIAAEMRPDSVLFHVFLWSDRVAVQAVLFGVFALLAVLLVLGWRTRVVSVLVFVFLASLVRRNHFACHTGDVWLKALCFWAMFLPLGAHFSLDRLRSRWRPPEGARVLSLATAGVLVQILVFYAMTAALKSRYDVWTHGEAVWVFTHLVEYTRPLGARLGEYPGLCRILTLGTLVLEGLGPFLLFSPVATARVRVALFVLFTGFHLTLQSLIHIGIFQLTSIVALTLFLPGSFWDGLARRAPAALRARWEGLVGAARARWSRAQVERPAPGPLARAGKLVASAGLVLAMAVIAVSNVNTLVDEDPYGRADRPLIPLPQVLDDYGRQMSLVQSWNMFTDIQRLYFGWFLVLGQDETGAHVNVLAGTPAGPLEFPEHYARFFPNHNSRRYWRQVAQPEREYLQKPMCDYLAREWEAAGHAPLTHMAIFHVGSIPLEKRPRDTVKRICVWEAPHEPLKSAAAEVQQLWSERRASWNAFLEGLPKTAKPPL